MLFVNFHPVLAKIARDVAIYIFAAIRASSLEIDIDLDDWV